MGVDSAFQAVGGGFDSVSINDFCGRVEVDKPSADPWTKYCAW
ncbi:hypothetical protein CDHC01_0052 [Corynebacterium diphtheriae HC01]|nr:hypothetical protein CD241_0053 [Corynebacterium diphtheriae 241]AEX73305.1 hypothetical protein CDHC01_0052 [Corynebacterium diphtheriae HC01]